MFTTLLLLALATFPACAGPKADPAPAADTDAAERARIRAFLEKTKAQALPAPPLGDHDWLNTSRPLSLADLRGKVVIFDFWTYCCINCMHVLPDLAYLEQRFAGEPFAVVGVHSAKFDNERDTDAIRDAIRRYGIEHPVVNDGGFGIWNAYGANAWPTFVVVGPDGSLLASMSGEGHRRTLELVVEEALDLYKDAPLDASPLPIRLETETAMPGPLRFPGKILATDALLVISDSGHDRLVIAAPDGSVQRVIGDGTPGLVDGPAETARFHDPQGTALVGTDLYVADTGNHAIRKVDLRDGSVTTVAGNGEQGQQRSGVWPGKLARPSSPWDLVQVGDDLVIANAGTHQLWSLSLKNQSVTVLAGTGREARQDGPASDAAFAQPSGLATDGRNVFLADSESSSVRELILATREVTTLVGASPEASNLFDYGDVDGASFEAKLQHPLSVAVHDGRVYVADSYNHKLKLVDPERETITTLGGGDAGLVDGRLADARFSEPGGLSWAAGKLYVADTNNHAIRVVDLAEGTVSTLPIDAPVPMAAARAGGSGGDLPLLPGARTIELPPASGTLEVRLELPKGRKLTEGAPSAWQLLGGGSGRIDGPRFTVDLPASGTAEIRALVYHCQADRDCRIDALTLEVPVRDGGASKATVQVE